MATLEEQKPKNVPVYRTNSDTRPLSYRFTEAGAAKDIAGYAYRLTVNTEENPSDATNKLFHIDGVIQGDGSAGIVDFNYAGGEEAQTPGRYFYDIKETDDLGTTLTIVKSTYTVGQDITKD